MPNPAKTPWNFGPALWGRLAILGLAVAITAGVSLQWISGSAIDQLETGSRDLVMQTRVQDKADDRIVMVDIDESSIRQLGPWPWSRDRLADLIEGLNGPLGAQLVVLDIVLPDPKDSQGDLRLQQLAMDRKLVLAQVFDFVDRDLPIISGKAAGSMGPTRQGGIPATGIVANHVGLEKAPCVGNIGFIPDSDGKLRSVIHHTQWLGESFPSLSFGAVNCLSKAIGAPLLQTGFSPTQLAELSPQTLLRFDLNPNLWAVIPAAQILSTKLVDPTIKALVQDRIVVIGSSALGLSDRVATPLSPSISGMFVHAQAISEILSPRRHFLSISNNAAYAALQSIVVLAFGIAILFTKRLRWLGVAAAVSIVIWGFFVVAAIQNADPRPVTGMMIGLLLLGLFLIPYEWAQARARNRLTAKILARYVSKPVLKDLLAQKSFDPLKPRTAEITVLVADMVGYSEKVATQDLDKAALITREFLDALTQPVWSLRGTLDRYTGDGLVAFWGAPIADPDHAVHAIEAAQQMLKNLNALNERLVLEGLPRLSVRIGLASGTAQVGDFGTRLRASYTAVGSCINMASRLEGAAKPLGESVLIAEETARLVRQSDLTVAQKLVSLGTHEIRGIGQQEVFKLA